MFLISFNPNQNYDLDDCQILQGYNSPQDYFHQNNHDTMHLIAERRDQERLYIVVLYQANNPQPNNRNLDRDS